HLIEPNEQTGFWPGMTPPVPSGPFPPERGHPAGPRDHGDITQCKWMIALCNTNARGVTPGARSSVHSPGNVETGGGAITVTIRIARPGWSKNGRGLMNWAGFGPSRRRKSRHG